MGVPSFECVKIALEVLVVSVLAESASQKLCFWSEIIIVETVIARRVNGMAGVMIQELDLNPIV